MIGKDYIGEVVSNSDPTYTGRCKIRVFGVFDELPSENIPWFVPMNSGIFGSNGAGSISIPKIGDIVRVRFSSDDYYSGEYSGMQNIDPDLASKIKDDYENTHVLLFDSDKELMIIYQNDSGLTISLATSVIRIAPDGNIQATHQNGTNTVEITDTDINIVTAGTGSTINIVSTGDVVVNSPHVSIESDSVDIGNSPDSYAVKGDKLVKVLQEISSAIKEKYPYGSILAGRTFSEILSSNVKLK